MHKITHINNATSSLIIRMEVHTTLPGKKSDAKLDQELNLELILKYWGKPTIRTNTPKVNFQSIKLKNLLGAEKAHTYKKRIIRPPTNIKITEYPPQMLKFTPIKIPRTKAATVNPKAPIRGEVKREDNSTTNIIRLKLCVISIGIIQLLLQR